MITEIQFAEIFPACPNPDVRADAASKAWSEFGFIDPDAQAAYLAICGNETGGYTLTKPRENMNYSSARAYEVFGDRAAACVQYCGRGDGGQAFANCIYANMLGNGPYETGDGWRFRGGFDVQLTFRGNYTPASVALGLPDLLIDPDEYVSDPHVSARIAAWFMGPYAGLLPLMSTGSREDFLTAAYKVGRPADASVTPRRLNFWSAARFVLSDQPPPGRTVLRIGDSGEDVRQLQEALNDKFDAMIDADGFFGSITMLAVRHFQQQRGLTVDGIAGPATKRELGL